MPPAVAQAPIVTSVGRRGAQPDDLLGLLRRADRAFDEAGRRTGPDERREVASANSTMSTRSAIASSSSSRSSSVSWQPSHDANLTTPIRGRVRRRPWRARRERQPSEALPAEGVAELGDREDGAVAADEERAQLAVAAQPDAAGHVPLERQPDVARRRRRDSRSAAAVACIIRSGPQTKARRPLARPTSPGRRAGSRCRPGRANRARPGRRSPRPRCRSGRRGPPSRRRTGGRAASARRGTARTAPKRGRSARTASMTGRSGASPMPPATITTSPAIRRLDRPAAPSGPRRRGPSPGWRAVKRSRRRARRSDGQVERRRAGSARSRSAAPQRPAARPSRTGRAGGRGAPDPSVASGA